MGSDPMVFTIKDIYMKNKEKILERTETLIAEGQKFVDNAMFQFATAGSQEFQILQTWLGQVLLLINVALPSSHPFRKQAAYYFSGGGSLGAQGMMSLLMSLAIEIKAGTMD